MTDDMGNEIEERRRSPVSLRKELSIDTLVMCFTIVGSTWAAIDKIASVRAEAAVDRHRITALEVRQDSDRAEAKAQLIEINRKLDRIIEGRYAKER